MAKRKKLSKSPDNLKSNMDWPQSACSECGRMEPVEPSKLPQGTLLQISGGSFKKGMLRGSESWIDLGTGCGYELEMFDSNKSRDGEIVTVTRTGSE